MLRKKKSDYPEVILKLNGQLLACRTKLEWMQKVVESLQKRNFFAVVKAGQGLMDSFICFILIYMLL